MVPVIIHTSKQQNIGSCCRLTGAFGSFTENGPINDFAACEAMIQNQPLQISLQGQENRMLYELARFRDAINSRDDAFYYRMVRQSRIAAGILEDAHSQMPW